jgi:hypothetical protein
MTPKPAPKTVHHPLAIFGKPAHLAALTSSSSRFSANIDNPARLAAITIIFAGDSSHSSEHLAMLETIFTAAQRSRLRTPCDVLGHVRRHAAPAMGSPFGAHLRDLGCAAHTIINASRRSRSYVPLGGHVPCSSFDDHVMLAFTVPASAFVFRRSHSHSRSGFNVVRSCERSSSIPLRVHTLRCSLRSKQSALTFSCSCPRSSFDAHGRTHSVGSQSTGSRDRVTFRRL